MWKLFVLCQNPPETLRRLHSFLWDGIIAGTVPVCLEGEGSIGGCLVAHSWLLLHRHHSHQSESLLQSAEGFLKEAAGTGQCNSLQAINIPDMMFI